MYLFIIWISTLLCSLTATPPPVADTESIQIQFTFDKPCEGQIHISCFQNTEGFKNPEKAVLVDVLSCQSAITIEGVNPDLPRAIMGFIDLNGNKKMDYNIMGIPSEPYAVSNGCRAKWGAPRFEEAAESNATKEILLEFKYWKNR